MGQALRGNLGPWREHRELLQSASQRGWRTVGLTCAREPPGWEAAQGMSAAVGRVPRTPRAPKASVYPPLGQALQPPADTRPRLLELQLHVEPEVPRVLPPAMALP